MAIRKSPYKVNQNGIDEAFLLPERDENEKRQSPEVKVRRARPRDESAKGDERTLRRGSLASLFDEKHGTGASHRASRRGDTEILADALLFGGPHVDNDELEEHAPTRRTVTFGSGTEPSQRGFAMDAREKKRRKAARGEARAEARSVAGTEAVSPDSRDDKKHAAKSIKEPAMRLGSLLGEPMAQTAASRERVEEQAAAMSPQDAAADARARGEDVAGTPKAGGYSFPPMKKTRRDMESPALAFPTRFLRRGPDLDEEEEFRLEEESAPEAYFEHGGHDSFGQDAADNAEENALAHVAPHVDSRDGLEPLEVSGDDPHRTEEDEAHEGAGEPGKAAEDAEDARAAHLAGSLGNLENEARADGEQPGNQDIKDIQEIPDIRDISREERGNALRMARRSLFFPMPGAHVADVTTGEDATTTSAEKKDQGGDQAMESPGLARDEIAAEARSGVEKLSRHPDLAGIARLEEEYARHAGDEAGSQGNLEGNLDANPDANPDANLWDRLKDDFTDDLDDEDIFKNVSEDASEDEARDKPDADAPPLSGEEAGAAQASASDRTRARQTKIVTGQKPSAGKRTQKDIAENVQVGEQKGVQKGARELVSEDAEVPNLLILKEAANPLGLGAGTTPRARVHFARFLTWTTLTRHVVSLRDERGHFAAPGLLGALEDNNAAVPILTILRKAAKKRGWPLNVHRIFVPVIYPDQADYHLWKQAANASDQSMVFLHHWLKYANEDEVLFHFGISLPKTRRQRNVNRCLWENRESLSTFFEDPRHANCRGLVLRDGADLFFGKGSPLGNRPVNYCILRPEWVVDIRPVGATQYLLSTVRKNPKSYIDRIRKLLVTTPDALALAKRAEDRSAKRSGQDIRRSAHSGVNDGLELILSAHKPYGRRQATNMA